MSHADHKRGVHEPPLQHRLAYLDPLFLRHVVPFDFGKGLPVEATDCIDIAVVRL